MKTKRSGSRTKIRYNTFMPTFLKEKFSHILLAVWLGSLTTLLVHVAHHQPVDTPLLDFVKQQYAGVAGALLMLLTGVAQRMAFRQGDGNGNGNGNGNSKPAILDSSQKKDLTSPQENH